LGAPPQSPAHLIRHRQRPVRDQQAQHAVTSGQCGHILPAGRPQSGQS